MVIAVRLSSLQVRIRRRLVLPLLRHLLGRRWRLLVMLCLISGE